MEVLHRQRNLQHPGQLGTAAGGRSRTWCQGSAWHTWVCTCGLLPAHPGCTGSARVGRLPGKCPEGRDGQGCAPCPARKALARAASPAQLQLGTASLCSSRGWREFPGKAAHPCGMAGSREGHGCSVSLEHPLLCSPQGPLSETSQLAVARLLLGKEGLVIPPMSAGVS